jgi:hypothetical protein
LNELFCSRILLHAYSYTHTLTRLLLHTSSYTHIQVLNELLPIAAPTKGGGEGGGGVQSRGGGGGGADAGKGKEKEKESVKDKDAAVGREGGVGGGGVTAAVVKKSALRILVVEDHWANQKLLEVGV